MSIEGIIGICSIGLLVLWLMCACSTSSYKQKQKRKQYKNYGGFGAWWEDKPNRNWWDD